MCVVRDPLTLLDASLSAMRSGQRRRLDALLDEGFVLSLPDRDEEVSREAWLGLAERAGWTRLEVMRAKAHATPGGWIIAARLAVESAAGAERWALTDLWVPHDDGFVLAHRSVVAVPGA